MQKNRWLGAAIIPAAALVLAGVSTAHAQTHHAAKKDPSCVFTKAEWDDWFNGPRWGTDLPVVENNFAHCVGSWVGPADDWKGNTAKVRGWTQQNGYQLRMTFVWNNGVWNANDTSTYNAGSGSEQTVCNYPRPSGDPCSRE